MRETEKEQGNGGMRETEREREHGNEGMGTGDWERGTERKFNKGNYNRT
jgi:hypothetical protein